ncbi:MAG: hypothetical protein H6R18_926 [Proteobacteria bacterium]|nr:hypothetical protein [Pseudomonadota bacterium]
MLSQWQCTVTCHYESRQVRGNLQGWMKLLLYARNDGIYKLPAKTGQELRNFSSAARSGDFSGNPCRVPCKQSLTLSDKG